MSTRSGKTYNEPKRSKKRTHVKDTTFDGTTPKEDGADYMDISTASTRDLRSSRSSVKDSTFDKSNSSMTKNDRDSATDSNWIISDLSNKVKKRESNLSTHLNGSVTSLTNGQEKESEVDSDTNLPTKRLRKRKTSVANNTFDKTDKVNTTYEKETDKTSEMDETVTGLVNIKKKSKNKTMRLIMNENNTEKNTETDTLTVPRNNKKKSKNKPVTSQIDTEPNKTFEKDEPTTVAVDKKKKHKTLVMSEINTEIETDDTAITINKKKDKKKTHVINENNTERDTETHKALEKDEPATVPVNIKKKGKSKTLLINENNTDKDTETDTLTVSGNNKKKSKNKTLRSEINNQIDTEADKTFEKYEPTTVVVDKKKKHKNKTLVMSEINTENEIDETATAVSRKKDKKKALVISEINTERETENDLNSPNVADQQIKKKKKKVKGGKKKKQKGKSKEDEGEIALDKADNILDTTFDKEMETEGIEEVISEVNKNEVQKDLVLNTLTASKKNLRSNKSIIKDTTFEKEDEIVNTTYEKVESGDKENEPIVGNENNIQKYSVPNALSASKKDSRSNNSYIKDTTFEKEDKIINTTIEKIENSDKTSDYKESNTTDISKVNVTFDKNDRNNDTFEKDSSTSFDTFKKGAKTRKSSINEVFNTSNHSSPKVDIKNQDALTSSAIKTRKSLIRQATEINSSSPKNLDSTFDKTSNIKASQSAPDASTSKLNSTFDKEVSKSSLISSDNSVSRISITSDESAENIMNTTPVLVESSLDVSEVKESPKEAPKTPLKREGTFTKDTADIQVQSPHTPGRSRPSLTPAAGCTPYHIGKSSQKKPMLNITRSIEKRLSVDAPRLTRVMFCSPVDIPVVAGQEKRKIIKSNLKGSNKSFVFDESASVSRPGRKRSYTHSDVDEARAKRSRLAEDLQQSVDRLSRPRTGTTTVKPAETTPKKQPLPFKSKSETKPSRTRLPNFAALHQRQFDKMESLGECQERKAKRAKQMLTPTGSKNMLERISPTNTTDGQKQTTKEPPKPKEKTDTPTKKTDTPTKKLPTLESLRPGFTRFGFKLNLDINPFSVPPKNDKPKERPNGFLQKAAILPSVAGATSVRREVAKQTVMREKSLLSKRKLNRSENRTIIKGVRTNRRFELQMKLRNVE